MCKDGNCGLRWCVRCRDYLFKCEYRDGVGELCTWVFAYPFAAS